MKTAVIRKRRASDSAGAGFADIRFAENLIVRDCHFENYVGVSTNIIVTGNTFHTDIVDEAKYAIVIEHGINGFDDVQYH